MSSSQATAVDTNATGQFYIGFDDVPSGTVISNQFPPAVFSTTSQWYLLAHSQFNYGSTFPNILDHGPIVYPHGYVPLYVDFTTPVNNLKFYILAVDDNRPGIAQINIFQNHRTTPSATISVNGFGNAFAPVPIDLGSAGYNNITRIEVFNITDANGIGYDDFSFTVAPPTPTPTPTPSPSPTPFPPTNLHGEGHIEEITLVWDLQANTTSYNIRRKASSETSWTVIATGVQPENSPNFGLIGRYRDNDANPDISYSYAVRAVNGNGESEDSNVFSASLAPSCGDYVEPAPLQRQFTGSGNGWTLTTSVSDKDGFVVKDVSLNGRYMAEIMSVPYFFLKTSKMPVKQRGELTSDSNGPMMRARLLRYEPRFGLSSLDGHIKDYYLIAQYAVDRLTPTSKSCLLISQEYDFLEQKPGDHCEPTGTSPCARFRPKVSYEFKGRGGETLESINIAQRLHYREAGNAANTVGLFRDCDVPVAQCGLPPGVVFKDFVNPLLQERADTVVQNGRDIGSWDNMHQTHWWFVSPPLTGLLEGNLFGCPECVHTHWRWGALFGQQFNYGLPIVGDKPTGFHQTNQDVEIGILRYKQGEEHPSSDFHQFLSKDESIRDRVVKMTPGPRHVPIKLYGPADVVFWYSGTSYEPISDLFYRHYSFFNPENNTQMTVANSSGNSTNSPESVQDGIRSITYGHVFEDGATTFSNVDPSVLPPLPAGYVALDNRAYKITTQATVSGPHLVAFDVPSITDQTVFNDLAIFHLEQDPFDPDNAVWVDDTILSPNSPAPDFANKIVDARIDYVGTFAVGKLIQPQPDPGSSDLSVTVSHLPNSVVVENNLTYMVHVTNSGPEASTGIGIVDVLPEETTFVSVSSSQGTCKHKDRSVYCKLGTLVTGSSVDVSIIVNTFEDKTQIPAQGISIVNSVGVAGDGDDPNIDNNSVTETTSLLPNTNTRPSVIITAPITNTTYVGPATVVITATAADSDGSVSQVDFYDGATLLGAATPTGTANQYQRSLSASFGPHTYVAVATDNGGRTNSSDPVSIFVNGAGSINITSPSSDSVLDPSANVVVTANATNSSGPISKVEFFANSTPIGEGSATGANQYSVTWSSVSAGTYSLSAVLTDSMGVVTTSLPVNVAITSKPNVAIISPSNGTSYSLLSHVTLMATAQDSDGFVSKLDFYANGVLVGSGSPIGQDRFTVDWTQLPSGVYSITAVATDNLGVSNTSAAITIGINTPSTSAGEFIWFDDDVPAGATKHADGDVDWYWVDANPASFSGTKAHQSRNFAQVDSPNTSVHRHYFDGATSIMPIAGGDKLFTYVFLDSNNLPRELMLEWKDANSWEHRAYWGANRINSGTDGTNSRRYMGALPKAGTWVRLEIPASAVGLEGSTLDGMAFTLDAGRATWDLTGKATSNSTPPPMTLPGDSVWIEDGLPTGAVTATVNDVWDWVANLSPFGLAHRSFVSVNHNTTVYRSHSFTGAQTQMQVNPGDVLFTYVWMDPSAKPDQIMLQWYDGTSWGHRAFWGENFIGHQFGNLGIQGTESQRFMGGLPPAGSWYRLEIPASYVGLEGKSVSGMAFSVYGKEPTIAWDRSGIASQLKAGTVPLPLSATTAVWRTISNTYGYAFETNDLGPADHTQPKISFYAYPNQAAGTVPMYRFRRPDTNNLEYFYAQCKSCYDGNGWTLDVKGDSTSNDKGVAFYVYPDATTPGAIPLYLYQDSHSHYVLTTNQSEVTGTSAVWGYVFADSIPTTPSNLVIGFNGLTINWQDNSSNETGFRIERDDNDWTEVGTVGANITHYDTNYNVGHSGSQCVAYRVRATNQAGTSAYVSASYGCHGDVQPDDEVIIPGQNSGVAPQDLAIVANSIDPNSTSSIAKVEFFANSNKLGEVANAPYIFLWNGAPEGTYTLTASATNTSGATFNPGPVVTDWPSSARIVSPSNGDLVDQNFAITANGFDLDGNGSITKVEFFANGNKVGEAANAPHVFTWNNAPAGTYSLVAKATDAVGVTTTSSPVSVTVDAAPSVSITSPANGAALNATSLTISASASDSDGSISKVEFFQGSTKLGETTSAPYDLVWSNVVGGNYSLTAVATDNLGRTTVSSPVGITVNNPPNISITTSSTQDVPSAPAQITINADANDGDGTISKVEFYQGTSLLATDLTSPYSYTWSNVAAGSYSISAKATDNLGAVTTSNVVSITVNAKPNVSLTSPSNGTYFTSPAFVNISAAASDSDGTISRVEFYRGTTLISTVTASPYNFAWSNVPAGTYTLTARAVDNVGASTTSSGVTITVTPNSLAIGKIAFASNRDGCAQIYLMNTDGTGQNRLTNDVGNDESPKWSPDNSRIVFQSDRDYQSDGDNPIYGSDIYVMNWDGSGVSRLTSAAYDDIAPVWSPDGSKIAFQSFRNGVNNQIYVMNADGSGQVNISNSTANDTQPAWSPDGSRIAFVSDRDQAGFPSVYVMSANGSGQTRLTSSGTGFLDQQPAWSPDGTKLAFITTRDSTVVTWDEWDSLGNLVVKTKLLINKEVYVMNADGSSQVRLTNIMGNDDSPAWAPDGTKIVFRSDRDRNCCDPYEQVWAMNADGSNQVNLSNNNSGDYCPSWSH
jgi:uncharacterized repeat protein (TIGR01451 family)